MLPYLKVPYGNVKLNNKLDIIHEQTSFVDFVRTFRILSEDEKQKYWDNSCQIRPDLLLNLANAYRISINGSAYRNVCFESTEAAHPQLYIMRIPLDVKHALTALTPYIKDWSIVLYRAYEDLDVDIIKYIVFHQLPCNLSYQHILLIDTDDDVMSADVINNFRDVQDRVLSMPDSHRHAMLSSFIYRCRYIFTLMQAKHKFTPGCSIQRLPRELINLVGDFF